MDYLSFIVHSIFSVAVHDPRTTSVASPISTNKDERNFVIANDKGNFHLNRRHYDWLNDFILRISVPNFLFYSFIDYTIHPNHNCGGNRIVNWSNGSNAKYGQIRGLLNCSEVCMNQIDCDGFSHRISDDVCGLWRKAPLNLRYDKNFDCYQKYRSKFRHRFLSKK